MSTGGRTPFTDEDDQYLVKYIAKYCPGIAGRAGNKLYQDLVEDVNKKWAWSKRHTWHSWRERYRKNQDRFNHRIRLYQKKKNLPQEHHTVSRSCKSKTGATTAAAEEADDDDEDVRQRKRKRVSESGNGPDKRPKHDQAPSVTRPVQKRASAQAGAVAGPSKHRQSAPSSGHAASSKTGITINQGAKRPPDSGPPPAENTDTEEEDEVGPVHSDDYCGEIFADQAPDDDESEVNAMLTDGMDEENHHLPEPPNSPHEDYELVYPDLKTLPSPNLTTRELHLPGQYDSAHSRPASPAEVPIQSKRRPFLIHPSQEPTPPVSGADDSTLTIDARVSAKKPAVQPLLLKDPLLTNPTNKNQTKSIKPRRQNIDDDPFETPPLTPIRSQPAAKSKRPPILIQGGFRTAFNSRPTRAGSDSDSVVEIVETKKTWPPERNKGVTTLSKTPVKPKNDTGPVQKVGKGKGNDQNVQAAPLTNAKSTNRLKGTETVVAKGGVDENHAMDVDDEQADGAVLLDKGVEGKTFSPIQLAADGKSNKHNGKGRAEIESDEGPTDVTKVNVTVNTEQVQASMIPDPPPRRRQPVQVNAVATSSKVTLADLPKTSSNSSPQLPYESASMIVESLSPKPVQQRLVQSSVSPPSMAQISSVQKTKNYQSLIPSEASLGTSSTDSAFPQFRPVLLSRTLSADIPSTPVRGDSVTLVEKVEQERKLFEDEMPLPAFTSTPLNKTKSHKVDLRKIAARPHRPHHKSSEKRSPHVDLRQVALRRTSLFQSMSSHTSSRSSTPSNMSSIAGLLPPDELEVVFEFGVRGALEKMAADLGFAYKPVRLIFEQTKSFSKTLVVLRRIMEAGNKVGNETLAELALEDDEEDNEEEEEANRSHILDGLSFDTRHKPEAKRPSLNVKPVLDDDEISEYSPPTKSRAGQFSRLVKQGREDEALRRERRRSGPLPRNSLPLTRPPTPSPPPILHPKTQPGDLTSGTVELSEEEMYELFGGPLSPSTEEDSQSQIQPEPNVQELKAEFKRLATIVKAHDTTALEEFEQKLDPDVLRVWTMELILEQTAPALKTSQ